MLQLRNLIYRTLISTKPKNNVNASEDFLRIVFVGHVVAASMQHFGIGSVSDQPNTELIPEDYKPLPKKEKQALFFGQISTIVDELVDLKLPSMSTKSKSTLSITGQS